MASRDLTFRILGSDDGGSEAFKRLGQAAADAAKRVSDSSGKMDERLQRVGDELGKLARKFEEKRLKVKMDDGDAKAKLDDLSAKMVSLSRKVANPRISLDGFARAEAELDSLGRKLDEFGRKRETALVRIRKQVESSRSSLFGGIKGWATGGGGNPLLAAGGLLALPLAGPLAGVGLGAAGMLAAGSAGMAAFGGLVAQPIKKTIAAQQSLQQNKISIATAKIEGNAKALNSALAQRKAILQSLSPVESSFLGALNSLGKAWNSLTGKLQGKAMAVVTKAMSGLVPIISELAPLFSAAIPAMSQFVGILEKGLASPAFKSFVSFLAAQAGPALSTFARVIGGLGKGFAGLVEASTPLITTVEHGLASLFGHFGSWGQSLVPFAGATRHLGLSMSQMSSDFGKSAGFTRFVDFLKANGAKILSILGSLWHIFTKIAPTLAKIGGFLLTVVSGLLKFIAPLVAAHPKIAGFAAALGLVVIAGGPVLRLITGLAVAAYEVIKHWKPISHFFVHDVWDPVKNAFKTAWGWIDKNVIKPIEGAVEPLIKIWQKPGGFFTHLWKTIYDVFHNRWVQIVMSVIDPIVGVPMTIVEHWGSIVKFFTKTIWGGIKGAFEGSWKWVHNNVIKPFLDIPSAIQKAWGSVAQWVNDNVLTPLGNFFRNGINGIIDILNGLITAIDIFPGVNIAHIQKLANGGTVGHFTGRGVSGASGLAGGGGIPGYSPGHDSVPAMLSPGEYVIRPEAARAIGMSTLNWLNAQGFASGGSVGGSHWRSWLNPVHDLKAAGGLLGKGVGWLVSRAESAAKAMLSTLPAGMVQHLGDAVVTAVANGIKSLVAHLVPKGGSIPTGSHAALIAHALGLSGVAATPGNESAVNIIVSHESGWNPTAINLSDINARLGHPSQGLMQTIPSTFAAYALAGLGGIDNPLANLVAGIRYAVSRYGTLGNVPGVRAVRSGLPYVGYDSGGYLQPGFTLAYNGTGAPEPVGAAAYGPLYLLVQRIWNITRPWLERLPLAIAAKLGPLFSALSLDMKAGFASTTSAIVGAVGKLGSSLQSALSSMTTAAGSSAASAAASATTAVSGGLHLSGKPIKAPTVPPPGSYAYFAYMSAQDAKRAAIAKLLAGPVPAPGTAAYFTYMSAKDAQRAATSYDRGGYLPPGLTLAYNGTGRPEPVGAQASAPVHVHVYIGDREITENVRVVVRDELGNQRAATDQWRRMGLKAGAR